MLEVIERIMSLIASRRACALGCAALLLLAPGCNRRSQPRQTAAEADTRHWDDTARFLAGLTGRAGGPFRKLEDTTAWRGYAAEFDESWKQVQREQFQAVDAFQKRELTALPGGQFGFY